MRLGSASGYHLRRRHCSAEAPARPVNAGFCSSAPVGSHTHTVSLYINLMGLELKPCVCSWISGAALLRHDDLHRSASPFASVFVPQIADVTCCGEVLPLYPLLNSLLCLKILHVFILSHSAHDSGLRPCSNLSLPFYYYDACCTYGRADRK